MNKEASLSSLAANLAGFLGFGTAAGMNAENLLTAGTNYELGLAKKPLRGKIIERLAEMRYPKKFYPNIEDKLAEFTKLPKGPKDFIKSPLNIPQYMTVEWMAPYTAGRRRGQVLKRAKSFMPKEMYDAFKQSISMNPEEFLKGKKYMDDIAADFNKNIRIGKTPGEAKRIVAKITSRDPKVRAEGYKRIKQFEGIAKDFKKNTDLNKTPQFMKDIFGQITSTDAATRAKGYDRIKKIKSRGKIALGITGGLAAIGAGYMLADIYSKIKKIKTVREARGNNMNRHMREGFNDEMQKVAGLMDFLKPWKSAGKELNKAIVDSGKPLQENLSKALYSAKEPLAEATERGMKRGMDPLIRQLQKQFGFKGALTTGAAVASGMVLGSYISNMLAKGIDQNILREITGRRLPKSKAGNQKGVPNQDNRDPYGVNVMYGRRRDDSGPVNRY